MEDLVPVWNKVSEVNGIKIHVQATHAETDIDVKGIQSACTNIMNTAKKSFENIGNAIIKVECGDTALAVADKTMQPVIEDTGNAIKKLPEQMVATLEEIEDKAIAQHNVLQRQYNKEAKLRYAALVAEANNRKEDT